MKKQTTTIKDKAVILTDKSAKLICARKKKEIVLPDASGKHVGKPIFLCGKKVYGIIILNEPTTITTEQCDNREKRHLLSKKEREELWPDAEKYLAYSFRIKRIFKEPVFYKHSKDLGFIDELSIDPERRKEFIKGVIGFRDLGKAPIETSWDGPEERRKASVEDLRIMCAWFDSQNPDVKSSYKLPHHKAEGQHSAVWNGVRAAMAALLGARGGTDIPSGDRRGVYNHLVKHYKQFDKEPPTLKSYSDEELEKMFPEYFSSDDLTEEVDFKRYYEALDLLEKNFKAKAGNEKVFSALLKLYKLLLNRMELRKARHGRRCTEEDRRMGRCKPGQIYRHSNYDTYDESGFTKAAKITVEGNFVRARLRSPSTIVDDSFRTITLSERQGIKAVIGRLKTDPEGPTHVQSVLFEKDKWTVASAREWIESHIESLKSAGYIKCSHCEEYFDYSAQPEVTMGLVNCPNCDTTVNQEGK